MWLLYIPQIIIIGIFVIPFSLGRIHESILFPIKWVLFVAAFMVGATFMAIYKITLSSIMWFRNMAVSFDQVGNAAINGNIDNTVSGRLGAKIESGKSSRIERHFCKMLSYFDQSTDMHCIASIERDEQNVL